MHPRPRELDDLLRHATEALDADTERRHILAAHAGDLSAMEQLVRSNLPWIATVVVKASSRGLIIPLDDAVQEGIIGFMRAIRDFDLATGCRLNTYATRAVRNAVKQANSDYMRVRLNRRWLQPKWVERREPEAREMANIALGCGSETEIATADGTSTAGVFGGCLDSGFEAIEVEEARVAAARTVRGWLAQLKDRDRLALELRYGLGGEGHEGGEHCGRAGLRGWGGALNNGLSMEEAGASLGVSKQRVARIEERAIRQLRVMARAGA